MRSLLAWQSIVSDIKEMKLNLDQFQARQASRSLDDAASRIATDGRETLQMAVWHPCRKSAPASPNCNGKLSQLNAGASVLSQEIERTLKENELLINEWAPIHLVKLLKSWFWKDDAKEAERIGSLACRLCCYLYMPRLKSDGVLRECIVAGASSRDYFGLAYAKEERKIPGLQFRPGDHPDFG